MEPAEWRSRITAIFQDFLRPQMLLRDAVGMGDLPRLESAPALESALERAGATTVVSSFEDGHDDAARPLLHRRP